MVHVALSAASPRLSGRLSSRRPRPFRSRRLARCATFSQTSYDSIEIEEEEGFDRNEFVEEFDNILEESDFSFEVGDRVEGLVFDVEENGVFIDFGGKEIGYCNTNELGLTKISDAREVIKPNTLRVFDIGATGVDSERLGGVVTLLSQKGIIKEVVYERMRQMAEFQTKFQVDVLERNAGGYMVEDDMGLIGFLPGKQAIGGNPAAAFDEEDELIGERITVRVLDVFEESDRVLMTQRGVEGTDADESKFAMGTVLEGVVDGVMPYGVFITADGVPGLLHSTQISGAHVVDVGSVFSVNDRVKVMVLGYDRIRNRLSFSTKKLEETSGDMLKDPNLVYEKAEEMAEKFKKEVEQATARIQTAESDPIISDVSLNTSRLGGGGRHVYEE